MALRLLELVLQERDSGDVRELLKDCKVLEHRHIRLTDDEVLVRILLDAVQSETVLDLLEKQYTGREGYRVMVLPVEATLPRAQVEPEETAAPEPSAPEEKTPERIGREELYEDIKNGAQLSRVYMALVALSTVVAAIGLYHNSVAVIIGAMVIAPLLGPNIALSLGITLGDVSLLRKGLLTALAGNVAALALSVLIGLLLDVDPTLSELVLRTQVGLGDIVLALASGCAGALAFTTGVSTALIGVMVAVAMLPPLVTSGLLFGGGHPALAMGALSLFLVNLICVNLAGVTTFLIQGIKPTNWWDKVQAKKATRIAITLSIVLLTVLVSIILLVHKG
ncbi:TIGR00341 family protein [Pectobacteriaceae bacterium CE90]|nr:TIGR00341 family protein [Pectobacteriaceae bacterium CE90]